jgi:hypothetical protein
LLHFLEAQAEAAGAADAHLLAEVNQPQAVSLQQKASRKAGDKPRLF